MFALRIPVNADRSQHEDASNCPLCLLHSQFFSPCLHMPSHSSFSSPYIPFWSFYLTHAGPVSLTVFSSAFCIHQGGWEGGRLGEMKCGGMPPQQKGEMVWWPVFTIVSDGPNVELSVTDWICSSKIKKEREKNCQTWIRLCLRHCMIFLSQFTSGQNIWTKCLLLWHKDICCYSLHSISAWLQLIAFLSLFQCPH